MRLLSHHFFFLVHQKMFWHYSKAENLKAMVP
uniref:Uncharacterized protein n=1 Tax=Rhizophora mucronata TaxID=61149 RepID=A0A2P2P5Z8_RHIMU